MTAGSHFQDITTRLWILLGKLDAVGNDQYNRGGLSQSEIPLPGLGMRFEIFLESRSEPIDLVPIATNVYSEPRQQTTLQSFHVNSFYSQFPTFTPALHTSTTKRPKITSCNSNPVLYTQRPNSSKT
ncbi:hypothetical protein VKT23_007297 [Stygiomarasmius scandens]|uniref:Uncharacterized protein n=1 Tax=Marasmiellus scandens TaxID=2682957 RepID=A0ABR1JLM7_9AGAR